MPFKPGRAKTGGRKRGTPNKKSKLLEDHLDGMGIEPIQELVQLLPVLEPKDKARVLIHLLNYVYPKRKSVEIAPIEAQIDHRTALSVNLSRLSDEELKSLASQAIDSFES